MIRPGLLILIFWTLRLSSPGHTDSNTTIKDLSSRIAIHPTAELFYQRATEYRAIKEKEHAIEDLESALRIEPENRLALVALIELWGKDPRAEEWIRTYQRTATNKQETFEAGYLLANHYHKTGRWEAAQIKCSTLHTIRPDQDPALDILHATVLLALDRPKDAARILHSATTHSKSVVLRNLWIDCALTAGETNSTLPIIETELSSSRFRSSWLIRRARAFLVLDRRGEALVDLKEALQEIDQRLSDQRPDLTLIADRGLIHALMGNRTLAKRDLDLLQQSKFPPDSYQLLSRALEARVK